MEIAIVISILSLIVSALGVWFHVFKEYIDRPRIAVSFDRERDLRPQWGTKFPVPHDGESHWLRVRVVNIGKWKSVKNCRVYLVGFQGKLPQGGWEDLLATDCRQLRWMHDHGNILLGRDLLPRVPNWFDVVATFNGGALAEQAPIQCFPGISLPSAGTFRLKIQVSSENASNSVVVIIDVTWNGGTAWPSLDAKLVSIDDFK